ncbi:MAG: metallophosphoesterase [Planctomycetota bacterium]|nr:metallophosphoesterase [Planctomycetota bacterium]MDA1137891.1 metallophosphoesterase [Planctomycetota bacterium]
MSTLTLVLLSQAILISLVPCSPSFGEVADAPYFYIVAADPQLLFNQKDDRNWRTTVDHINRLRPDFVIVCGDLIQAPNDAAQWENPKNLEAYDKLAAMYNAGAKQIDPKIKLYNVAGNHDVSLAPTPKTLAWYESRFGVKPWYRFEHNNALFVVLESNLIRNPSGAPDEATAQKRFIDESVSLAKSQRYAHRTAYMHHPLCLQAVDEADGYFNIPRAQRLDLIAQFKDAGFEAVFCGHYHRNAYVKTDNIELITTSSCGAPLGKDPLGFRIVKVYSDRLEHEYIPFERMPEKIELNSER